MKKSKLDELTPSRLELIAFLGHRAARKVLGKQVPTEPKTRDQMRQGLKERGFEAIALANIALVRLAASINKEASMVKYWESPGEMKRLQEAFELLQRGLEQARQLLLSPTEEFQAQSLELRKELTQAVYGFLVSEAIATPMRSHLLMVRGLVVEVCYIDQTAFDRASTVAQIHFRETCQGIEDEIVMQAVRDEIIPWALGQENPPPSD